MGPQPPSCHFTVVIWILLLRRNYEYRTTCLSESSVELPVCPSKAWNYISVRVKRGTTCLSESSVELPICPSQAWNYISVRVKRGTTCLSESSVELHVCPSQWWNYLSVRVKRGTTCLSESSVERLPVTAGDCRRWPIRA